MDPEEALTAWHEAGHAVMAVLCSGFVERVTIEPPYDDGPARHGDTVTRWIGFSERQLLDAEMRVSLAGPVAEMIYRNELVAIETVDEWAADWSTAVIAAKRVAGSELAAKKLLNLVTLEIQTLFEATNNWAAVCAVADELLAHETLENDQVADCIGFWQRR